MTKRRNKKSESKNDAKPKETKVEFLASLAGVLATGLFIIIFMVQAFAIPSSSMENTLLVGDHVFVNRIQKLDPLSLIINADAGWFFEMAGENDRALLQLRRTLELEPRFAPAHLYLGEVYLRKEMYSEAISAYRESANLGDYSYSAPLGYAYGRAGRQAEATKIVEQLDRRPNMSPTSIAIVYAGLGDKDRALAFLERAFREHDDSLIYIRSQTFFDPLRSDPRFRALLHKMAFPQ